MESSETDRIAVGKRLLQSAVEAVETKYLFLVPYGCFGDWQVATRDGKVMTTTDPADHFGGRMPRIFAEKHFLNTVPNEDLMASAPKSLIV